MSGGVPACRRSIAKARAHEGEKGNGIVKKTKMVERNIDEIIEYKGHHNYSPQEGGNERMSPHGSSWKGRHKKPRDTAEQAEAYRICHHDEKPAQGDLRKKAYKHKEGWIHEKGFEDGIKTDDELSVHYLPGREKGWHEAVIGLLLSFPGESTKSAIRRGNEEIEKLNHRAEYERAPHYLIEIIQEPPHIKSPVGIEAEGGDHEKWSHKHAGIKNRVQQHAESHPGTFRIFPCLLEHYRIWHEKWYHTNPSVTVSFQAIIWGFSIILI